MNRRLLPVLALFVVVLAVVGWRVSAQSGTSMVGHLSAAAHEVEEGYFSIGPESYVIVKPGSGMHAWLTAHLGREVTVSVEVAEPTD